jgi:hypothetical protein
LKRKKEKFSRISAMIEIEKRRSVDVYQTVTERRQLPNVQHVAIVAGVERSTLTRAQKGLWGYAFIIRR